MSRQVVQLVSKTDYNPEDEDPDDILNTDFQPPAWATVAIFHLNLTSVGSSTTPIMDYKLQYATPSTIATRLYKDVPGAAFYQKTAAAYQILVMGVGDDYIAATNFQSVPYPPSSWMRAVGTFDTGTGDERYTYTLDVEYQ